MERPHILLKVKSIDCPSHFLVVCLMFVRCLSLFFPRSFFSRALLLAGPGAKVRQVKRPLSVSHQHPVLSLPPLSRLIRRMWWCIIVLFAYNTCFNDTYNLPEGLVLVKAPSEVKGNISATLVSGIAGDLMKRDGTGEAGSLLYSITLFIKYNNIIVAFQDRKK